jgi:ribosomal protein S18 acetylase RimI-like enzyme
MAFGYDPIARWIFPEPHQYLTYMTAFVPPFAGQAFERDTAYRTDDFAAASLWLPPEAHSDQEALGELLPRAISEADQPKVFAFFELMGVHHPTEPHWYLPLIGVDPTRQGQGYGSALLRHALQISDRDRLPAYLEATSPHNRRLYERHDFEAIGEIQSADSPPMWPMLRTAR